PLHLHIERMAGAESAARSQPHGRGVGSGARHRVISQESLKHDQIELCTSLLSIVKEQVD
ncbi:MAG TPA: hypothetical protein VJX67_07390, partial [Blastocatellia bacterium]|nr:hypothetical protein [Blastocatellia bacterium]